MINNIMIFAAGRGTRMDNVTKTLPKSLIPILGKPILHYILELALTYPFKRIVINTHYLSEQIESFIEKFKEMHTNIPEIITIYEPTLLETGGAIKNAIGLLGNDPIFTLNSDVIIKPNKNLFKAMLLKWDASKMDFLLLLQNFNKAVGYKGKGDFELLENGRLHRPNLENNYSYMYSGLQILKPELISQNLSQIFSLREYYLNNYNIFGIAVGDYKWYHATTPEDIMEIEHHMRQSY